MRKLKFSLDRKSLETIYITFIRPLLEYADVIWDNCTQYEKDELEKIQIEAARIATGATKLVSINNFYKKKCWDTLQKRRDDHKLTLFYKMCNNIASGYLSSLIPQQVDAISQYNRETQMISKLLELKLVFITTLSCHRHCDNGTIYLSKQDNYLSELLQMFFEKGPQILLLWGKKSPDTSHTPTHGLQFTKFGSLHEEYH